MTLCLFILVPPEKKIQTPSLIINNAFGTGLIYIYIGGQHGFTSLKFNSKSVEKYI